MIEDLQDCSPFFSLTGDKQLDFAADAVTETHNPSALPPRGEAPEIRAGTFVAVEATRRVRLRIDRAERDYILVVPTDSDQCILAVGTPQNANLQRSWYGQFGNDPEVSRPEILEASLR